MKKDRKPPVTIVEKSGPGSNPKNKSKKDTTDASVNKIITSAVGNVKAKSGRGLTNEGTNVDYNEEG